MARWAASQAGPLWGIPALWGGVLLACHMPSSRCNLGVGSGGKGISPWLPGQRRQGISACLPYTKAPGAPGRVQSIPGARRGPCRFLFACDELWCETGRCRAHCKAFNWPVSLQVFKAVRNGVQDVAVKMLAQADTSQLQLFKRVRHLAFACTCCCQTPAWAAMPPEGSSWAVWHFHIWHAHPCCGHCLDTALCTSVGTLFLVPLPG